MWCHTKKNIVGHDRVAGRLQEVCNLKCNDKKEKKLIENKGIPSFTFPFSFGGGSELMAFLLAHKLAVRTHGGACWSPESTSVCIRKSTLMAPGVSQGLSCCPPLFSVLCCSLHFYTCSVLGLSRGRDLSLWCHHILLIICFLLLLFSLFGIICS